MIPNELICIVCPLGCHLTIEKDESKENGFRVFGNKCPRGEVYANKELTAPTRMLPTTVKIKGAILNRLPVKTEKPIPKTLVFDCMKVINTVEVTAPVKMGDIIIEDILGTGINIVATRSMKAKSSS